MTTNPRQMLGKPSELAVPILGVLQPTFSFVECVSMCGRSSPRYANNVLLKNSAR